MKCIVSPWSPTSDTMLSGPNIETSLMRCPVYRKQSAKACCIFAFGVFVPPVLVLPGFQGLHNVVVLVQRPGDFLLHVHLAHFDVRRESVVHLDPAVRVAAAEKTAEPLQFGTLRVWGQWLVRICRKVLLPYGWLKIAPGHEELLHRDWIIELLDEPDSTSGAVRLHPALEQ